VNAKVNILEGQTGHVKVTPTFEGKSALGKVEIDWSNTDMRGMVILNKSMLPIDNANAYLVLTALATSQGTGKVVFKYVGSKSDVENVGTATKTVDITVSPAVLNVVSVSPTYIKWIPGQETDIAITWVNGTQPVLATNPLLDLSTTGDNITIVSRSETGIRVKVNSNANATALPLKEQVIVAKYYSGQAKTVLNYALKPALTITLNGTINLKGVGAKSPFPFKIMDGTKDVTKLVKNIKASDSYLKFNDDGSFVVIKVDLLAVVRTVTYTFDYEVNGLVWSYTTKATVTIGNLINL
jgi:hypothetical protein